MIDYHDALLIIGVALLAASAYFGIGLWAALAVPGLAAVALAVAGARAEANDPDLE